MKTLIIKRIDPWSLSKISAITYAIISIVPAIGYGNTIIKLLSALIAFPIVYALAGLVIGYVSSIIYNFAVKRVGGIKVEVE